MSVLTALLQALYWHGCTVYLTETQIRQEKEPVTVSVLAKFFSGDEELLSILQYNLHFNLELEEAVFFLCGNAYEYCEISCCLFHYN